MSLEPSYETPHISRHPIDAQAKATLFALAKKVLTAWNYSSISLPDCLNTLGFIDATQSAQPSVYNKGGLNELVSQTHSRRKNAGCSVCGDYCTCALVYGSV